MSIEEQDIELLDERPSMPQKEGYHKDYCKCHRCSKWFNSGEGYYGYGSNPR